MSETLTYIMHEAVEIDIEAIINMRLQLQKYMESVNHKLWKINPDCSTSYFKNLYTYCIQDQNAKLVVCINQETNCLVGMALGRIQFHSEYIPEKSGRIDDVWIDINNRKNGLCGQLVASLQDFFSDHGVDKIILDHLVGDAVAQKVWDKLGFSTLFIMAVR